MATTTFTQDHISKLNEMLDAQVFDYMQMQEKSMVEAAINEKSTSCPSGGVLGIAAELLDTTPSELLSQKVKEIFHGEYLVKAYKPQFNEKNNSTMYPVRIKISDNKVISHNGTTYIYYKNSRELATVGSAIKICSVDKEQIEKALKYIDFLKLDTVCCTFSYLTEQVADYISAM